ncbi:MAG: YraN family protein [Betaproteobacteria bacterium]|nr:YraN family protein [Betaproteobacteria bacterium]
MNTLGDGAEARAAAFLAARGLSLVETNYRCRAGEIDLVLRDGETIVFVEVRLRRSARFGGAAYSIDARKQSRIIRTARHWLSGKAEPPCRFDVVLMKGMNDADIEWIRDAFTA